MKRQSKNVQTRNVGEKWLQRQARWAIEKSIIFQDFVMFTIPNCLKNGILVSFLFLSKYVCIHNFVSFFLKRILKIVKALGLVWWLERHPEIHSYFRTVFGLSCRSWFFSVKKKKKKSNCSFELVTTYCGMIVQNYLWYHIACVQSKALRLFTFMTLGKLLSSPCASVE